MKILGLIPARGGSKRIPNKNIKNLAGKPLIAYTIEAAKKSKYINRLIVTTDSIRIAATAKKCGAEVPFLRPRSIATSRSTEMEFYLHALTWLRKNEAYVPDLIVQLYPTSPFRTTRSIDKAIAMILKNPNADSLRSVRLCTEHPCKMWTISKGRLNPYVKSRDMNLHTLSYQMLPEVYIQNASIYITKPSTIIQKGSTTGRTILPFVMNTMESVDINEPIDFEMAETFIRRKNDK